MALSPARRCPTASDLPLGLGYLLPSLLQIHGWEVASDISFPARWATLEAQVVKKGVCTELGGFRVPQPRGPMQAKILQTFTLKRVSLFPYL